MSNWSIVPQDCGKRGMQAVRSISWIRVRKKDRKTGEVRQVGVPAALVKVLLHRTGMPPGQTCKVVWTVHGISFHYPDRSVPADPDTPWNGRTRTVPGERERTMRPERFVVWLEKKIGQDLAAEVMCLIAGTPVLKKRGGFGTQDAAFFARSSDNCRT